MRYDEYLLSFNASCINDFYSCQTYKPRLFPAKHMQDAWLCFTTARAMRQYISCVVMTCIREHWLPFVTQSELYLA